LPRQLLIGFCCLAFALPAMAQETTPPPSPAPTISGSAPASPVPADTAPPVLSGTASPAPAASPSASPTPSLLKKIGVKIMFVPPPMEGTISLGIYDQTGKLVRVLHQAASADEFVAALDGFITHWDGLDDAGKPMPPGHYSASGYMVGDVAVKALDFNTLVGTGTTAAPAASPVPGASPQTSPGVEHIMWFEFPDGKPFVKRDRIHIGLVGNPLDRDRAGSVYLSVSLDANGRSWLQTAGGLPLKQIDPQPGMHWVEIGQSAPGGPLTVFQSTGDLSVQAFEITNIADMMAFDCGGFDFAGVGKW